MHVDVTTLVVHATDVLVWSNDHVISWVESVGLSEYSPNLKESGVHGGVIALDGDFDYQKLALALQIPLTQPEVRSQFKKLLTLTASSSGAIQL